MRQTGTRRMWSKIVLLLVSLTASLIGFNADGASLLEKSDRHFGDKTKDHRLIVPRENPLAPSEQQLALSELRGHSVELPKRLRDHPGRSDSPLR